MRFTRGLPHGRAALAGPVKNPRACEYSVHPTLNCGSAESALGTIGVMLSGINTLKTPPKNAQAASHPAMIASSVWLNASHTNWRTPTFVDTSIMLLRPIHRQLIRANCGPFHTASHFRY
uniref:hypothetical protein n=1 Tax=Candidatus Mycobacterium methanotrophicum TaxID=2943498 RepID=UPI001C59041F